MIFSEKNSGKKIEVTSLRLGNGWNGRAVLSTTTGGNFSRSDWADCFSEPELLFQDVEKILKAEGRNCVAVKNLTIRDNRLKVVLKRRYPRAGLRQFFRSFRRGRAPRSFDAALKLTSCDIPAPVPLAALQKRQKLLIEQSIFVTEYPEGSVNLHIFLSEQLPAKQKERFIIKEQLGRQLADILAALHKNDLWYRDSKATNFIVYADTDGNYKVLLTDVDGIKPYVIRRRSQQLRSLWQLAASLLCVSAVTRTDYLRAFTAYSNLIGLPASRRRKVFRRLSKKAEAKYRRSKMENILIIKPSSLGDIIMALPVLSALRRSFPEAKISWLVRSEFAPLIENHPDLSEVILFDRKFLGKAWYNPRAFASLVALISKLRRGRFDAVIDLQGLFRTASLGWLSGCRKRPGMANAREFGHIFYTDKVAQDSSCIHLVDYYLKIAQAVGARQPDVQFLLPVDSAAENAVKKLLKTSGVDGSYACLVPGSAHADKCWPAEHFAAVADKISSKLGLSIIAAGAPPEKDAVEELASKASVHIANFAGATSISELVALLNGAKLVVSNDTGPGHIAAALGVPAVLIFGRSNPARVHPYNRPQCAAAVEPLDRGFKADSYNPKHDIKAVTVDEVFEKVCEQLNHRS